MNRDGDKGKIFSHRTMIIAAGQLFLILIILIRLYYLQVIEADKYKVLAEENRISVRILPPPRGLIYDRNMIPIAFNKQNFRVSIVAEQTANIDETLNSLKKIIYISDAEVKKIKKEVKRKRSFVPVKIKENLTWEEMAKIETNAPDLPGVIIDEGLTREYPQKEIISHMLGYVSSVTENDKIDDPLLEIPGFKIGKSGLEKLYENELRGKGGNQKIEVNAFGRVIKEIERNEGESGKDIVLSLDSKLQKFSYDTLGEESGSVILMDVHTGEILTMVSTPSFDPNVFTRGLTTEEWKELNDNYKKPLIDKSVSGQYSPGSTFKMIVALAALEAGVINEQTTFYCPGKMSLGNHIFHCWKDEGHGSENIVEALQHSCDVFFYEVAIRLGIDKIAEMARRFGLGEKLNIGFNTEKPGLIPDRDWKLGKMGESWQKGESIISAIGQGFILTTPIQLVTMTSRMVNGGYAVTPKFITDDNNKEKAKKIPIKQKYLDIVKKGMFAVVNKQHGTAIGSQFTYNDQKMAGKTGTTQVRRISMKERQSGVMKQDELKWNLRNHALFVGYAPAKNPKYAISVIIEHGGSGSGAAAPVAGKILKKALELDPLRKNKRK